jgi:short subunit dehydrogenase-like uncharacterized protein
MQKAVDVVLWGATGFTGRLIAQYLASLAARHHQQHSPLLVPPHARPLPSPLRLSLAGRSAPKLHALCDELDGTFGVRPAVCVVAADPSAQQADLDAMAASSRVLIAAAGPFSAIGTGVVAACVRNECDYVDVCGEVPFVRSVVDIFHSEAVRRGRLVVPMCGFSTPADLTVHAAVAKLWRETGLPARRVRTYVAIRSTSSGGTIQSGLVLKQQCVPLFGALHFAWPTVDSRGLFGLDIQPADVWYFCFERPPGMAPSTTTRTSCAAEQERRGGSTW